MSLTTRYFVRILETLLHSVLFRVKKGIFGAKLDDFEKIAPLLFKIIQRVLGGRRNDIVLAPESTNTNF